jgi:hypothetical protein
MRGAAHLSPQKKVIGISSHDQAGPEPARPL